jgi:hypothetical protein
MLRRVHLLVRAAVGPAQRRLPAAEERPLQIGFVGTAPPAGEATTRSKAKTTPNALTTAIGRNYNSVC